MSEPIPERDLSDLPVIVIGAGPQGLAAAAHLLERGLEPLVLESGGGPAAAVAAWSHVRLFSSWPELVDAAAVRLLAPTGWTVPTAGYPAGGEWIERYLAPLAAAFGDRVRYGARVTGVSRQGRDRLVSEGRAGRPFVVHVAAADGAYRLRARAVVDATGTWASPAPAGADGLRARGEEAAAALGVVTYRPPTPEEGDELSGGHVVVIGSGHSAMTAVIDLARTAQVSWVLRRGQVGDTFGGGASDALPRRGALGARARAAVDDGRVRLITGFRTEAVHAGPDGVVVAAEDGRTLDPADHVVVLTGFRPDLSFLSEVRLDLDPILQAPRGLADDIDPNVHSCGSVPPHGALQLSQPEPDLYLVGMKSYGRAPTFLALTGYEQVRSVAAAIAGDREAAARVELTLPETGVCGGSGTFDDDPGAAAGGCCGPVPSTLPLTVAPHLLTVGAARRAC